MKSLQYQCDKFSFGLVEQISIYHDCGSEIGFDRYNHTDTDMVRLDYTDIRSGWIITIPISSQQVHMMFYFGQEVPSNLTFSISYLHCYYFCCFYSITLFEFVLSSMCSFHSSNIIVFNLILINNYCFFSNRSVDITLNYSFCNMLCYTIFFNFSNFLSTVFFSSEISFFSL